MKNKIHVCLNKIFRTNKKIETASLYFPINNEIPPFDFINYLQKKNVTLSLPIIDKKNNSIKFKKWIPNDELTKVHLEQWNLKNSDIYLPQILVVPMLSFDRDFID